MAKKSNSKKKNSSTEEIKKEEKVVEEVIDKKEDNKQKDKIEDTIKRELEEELGITNVDDEIQYVKTFKYPTKNCIFNVYLLEIDQLNISEIKLQKEEVAEVKFLTCNEIKDIISHGDFLESHAYIFENFINC